MAQPAPWAVPPGAPTAAHLLQAHAAARGDALAAAWCDARGRAAVRLTFGELHAAARAVAARLREHYGVQPGDRYAGRGPCCSSRGRCGSMGPGRAGGARGPPRGGGKAGRSGKEASHVAVLQVLGGLLRFRRACGRLRPLRTMGRKTARCLLLVIVLPILLLLFFFFLFLNRSVIVVLVVFVFLFLSPLSSSFLFLFLFLPFFPQGPAGVRAVRRVQRCHPGLLFGWRVRRARRCVP